MAIDQAEAAEHGGVSRTHSAPKVYQGKAGFQSARLKNSMVDALRGFTADVQEKVLRPAAQAGAQVFYDEMKLRTEALDQKAQLRVKGDNTRGLLNASIYQYHAKRVSSAAQQVYYIGPNKKEAPHWFNVEFGHYRINRVFVTPEGKFVATKERLPAPLWTPASPYIRPTFSAKAADAVQAMQKRFAEGVHRLSVT